MPQSSDPTSPNPVLAIRERPLPPPPNDSPEVLPSVLPSVHPIVSQWRQLTLMDRRFPDFLPLLLSLTTGANRSSTTALRGDDAKITLGTLDEVGRHSLRQENGQVVTCIISSASFLGMVKSQTNANVTPSV